MKHFYSLLFIIFFFSFFTFAQSNFKPGLVVNTKGDTLRGFIDYKEWESSPVHINFKAAANGDVKQLGTDEISYFQVLLLESYSRYSGPISNDATNINRLTTGKDTSIKTATVFLKVEQDGNYITLYSYSDDLKKRYFVAEKSGGQPYELVYRAYFSADQDHKTVYENKYKGQLIYLSDKYNSNTDELRGTIGNANYDQDLVAIAGKINHSDKQTKRGNGKSPVSFYAGISLGLNGLKSPDMHYNYDQEISPSYTPSPKVAIGINVFTNPEVQKLVFRAELGFGVNLFKTYFKEFTYSTTKSYFTLNQYNVTVSPQVLYNIYNSASFKFFLDAGVSVNISSYSNNKEYDVYYNETILNYTSPASLWVSLPLTAGVTLNQRIGIFVTYTVPVIISADNYKYHSTQLGATYSFGKK